MKTINFKLNTDLRSGIGSSKECITIIEKESAKKILIFVDEGVANHSDYFQTFINDIKNDTIDITILNSRGSEEPDYDYVNEVADTVRKISELDLIIGIGGGSCMDVTKALAALYTNPGNALDYRGFDLLKNANIPTILIPTTAGTGSEVTINASFVDTKEMKKLGINGKYVHANYAILDANWLTSCPQKALLSSGLDAMVHTIESYMAKQSNAISRVFSKEAFLNLFHNLRVLNDENPNIEKLQSLLVGSYFAGAALFNSGSGIAGALSYPLGVHYKIPHGIAGGIFLIDIIEFNIKNGYQDYDALYDLINPNSSYNKEEKNNAFLSEMKNLWESLQVSQNYPLNTWGITENMTNEIVERMIPMQGAFDQNPIYFDGKVDSKTVIEKHII